MMHLHNNSSDKVGVHVLHTLYTHQFTITKGRTCVLPRFSKLHLCYMHNVLWLKISPCSTSVLLTLKRHIVDIFVFKITVNLQHP